MKKRIVTTVAIRNNPTSVPPLGLSMIQKNKLYRGVAIVGLFLVGSGGAGGYSYATSALPSGFTLNAATGEITGAPAALAHSVFTGTVTDSQTNAYSADFTLDVISSMNFEQAAPPDTERNSSYDYQFNVNGATGSVTYAVTQGAIMAGSTLSSGGLLSAATITTLGGTRVNFTVTATDSATGDTLDIPCSVFVFGELKAAISSTHQTITVNVPTTISKASLGYVGGEPPFIISLHTGSSLPFGLSMIVNPGSGSITFTAGQGFASTFLQFDVQDNLGGITPTSGMFLTAIDPNQRLQAKDGFGDIGDDNPKSIKIHSSDNTINVIGSNVGGDVVYDLSADFGSGGPPPAGSPLTTKGDLFGFDTADARVPVGTDGYVLTADSTAPLGVSYKPAGGGGGTVAGMPIWDSPAPGTYNSSTNGYDGYTWFQIFIRGAIHQFAQTWAPSFTLKSSGTSVQIAAMAVVRCIAGIGAVTDTYAMTIGSNAAPLLSVSAGVFTQFTIDPIAQAIDPQYDYYLAIYIDPTQPGGGSVDFALLTLAPQFHPGGIGGGSNFYNANGSGGYTFGDAITGITTIPALTGVDGWGPFNNINVVT